MLGSFAAVVVIAAAFLVSFSCGESEPGSMGNQAGLHALTGYRADLYALLSEEVRGEFLALPLAYQEALASYLWYGVPTDLVPFAVSDKIRQWGDSPPPLEVLLGKERTERFRLKDPKPVQHGHLLLSYYVHVLGEEPSVEKRRRLMREMADIMAPPPGSETVVQLGPNDRPIRPKSLIPEAILPSPDSVLTRTALGKRERLGPELQQALRDRATVSGSQLIRIDDIGPHLTMFEMFMLLAEPGLDVPSINSILTGDLLAGFRALPKQRQDRAAAIFRQNAARDYVHYVANARRMIESERISVALAELLLDYANHAVQIQTKDGGG